MPGQYLRFEPDMLSTKCKDSTKNGEATSIVLEALDYLSIKALVDLMRHLSNRQIGQIIQGLLDESRSVRVFGSQFR